MTDMNVETIEPETLDRDRVTEGDTLVLGAPHIGESHQIEQCAEDTPDIRLRERLTGPNRD